MSLLPIQTNGLYSTPGRGQRVMNAPPQTSAGQYYSQETQVPIIPGQQYQPQNTYGDSSQYPSYPEASNTQGPDTYQPSQSSLAYPSQAPQQKPGWTLTQNPIVTPVLEWFQTLPTWAKWTAAIGAAILGLWAGKRMGSYIGNNAGDWSKQFIRSFGPTPLGSQEAKSAKYDLHDARFETRRLRNQFEKLERSVTVQEELMAQAEAKYKSHIGRQGNIRKAAAKFRFRGKEGERLHAEYRAAKEVWNSQQKELKSVSFELNQAAKQQVDAHLELMSYATRAMVLKREEKLSALKQKLKEAQKIADKTEGENRDPMHMTTVLLEQKIKAEEYRLAEARATAERVNGLRAPSNIYVTPTGLTTIKRKGKVSTKMTGGLAVEDKNHYWMNSRNVKEATASYVKDPSSGKYMIGRNGKPIKGLGNIGFLPAKSTLDSAAGGLTSSTLTVIQRRYQVDGTLSEPENIGGFYTYPNLKKFLGIFGQSDWWKLPLEAFTDTNVKTAVAA
ncbi:MAG: hypothetical protein SFU25_00135 [Candidatus Caenarcaniphilales bacterium]|nr:hypothetical protein [Candidatus Caenarcaniphilales bacterium]